jgi:hypothetical protein
MGILCLQMAVIVGSKEYVSTVKSMSHNPSAVISMSAGTLGSRNQRLNLDQTRFG